MASHDAIAQTPAPSEAEYPGNKYVKAKLVLECTAISPTGTTNLAVVFDISPKWHLYWRNAGDSGLPPRVKFKPITGITFGEPQWPVPIRKIEEGEMLTYVYENELVLIVPVTISSPIKAGTNLNFNAEIDWLVCHDVCVPGRAVISQSWPVAADAKPSADAAKFTSARLRHPKPASSASEFCKMTWEGSDLIVAVKGATKITFLPHENDEMIYPENMLRAGESKTDSLRLHYGSDVKKLKHVTGVIAFTRDEVQHFQEISVAVPSSKAETISNK
jgi:DsbC/DsbD-like thiol-disulfide interchange protein